MKTLLRIIWLLAALLAFGTPRTAAAADIFDRVKSAPILEANPGVRSRAMGDAGTAGFWDVTNAWANPALLGLASGVRYEFSTYEEHDFDYKLNSARTTAGYGGIGLSTTGRPFTGLGRIERGTTLIVFDPPPITYEERVESWSAGVSVSQVATALTRHAHREPPAFTRWIDLSLGYSEKRVVSAIMSPEFPRHEPDAFASDLGFLLRAGAPLGDIRLDLAYGHAEINFNQPRLDGIPTVQDWRNGLAAHATWDGGAARMRPPGWLGAGMSPLLAASWAMDFVHTTASVSDFDGWGAELGVANVFFGRIGRQELAHTWGTGVGVPLGRFGGARWDYSERTRDRTLISGPEVRNGWLVWMDPLAIYDAAR